MKVVFWGTPEFAVPSLEGLLAAPDIDVLAVVTQPDKRRGRGSQILPSPVKQVAVAHQLPIWQPRNVKQDPDTLNHLRSLQADAFVVVAYGQILSPQILEMPRLGCINSHGSLLPKYRGAAPIQWALYHGETETGLTTMLMNAGMDTGDMLLKVKQPIGFMEDAHSLAGRLAALSPPLLIATLQQLEQGTLQAIPQDDSEASYAPLIQKSDYLLDWTRPAIQLHNQVRGFFPNSVTSFRQTALKVVATAPLASACQTQLPPELQVLAEEVNPRSGTPGEVVEIAKSLGPIVQTGAGLLLLREVQLSGKRLQSGWDFSNGVRLQVGERLGAPE